MNCPLHPIFGFFGFGGYGLQLFNEHGRDGLLRQPLKKGRKVSPGGGSDETPHDQGVAADIYRAFDGATSGKPQAAFSDWQIGLP